ncbi:sugar phosphate isomerase/epimerase family protein [Microbacterium sp.]|uniref:sugar phosphate isomerase/epimerase family protein n=1 Tax=Microbacterium sp. TaxID=51671 RepID=UPI0028112478|nr:sugar phosphate isomerase/epimerase family protein [Microbacterium sp.]
MRFGAHSQMFVHDIAENPAETVRTVADIGLDAIEIDVRLPEAFPVAEVRRALDETDIDLVLGVALPAERNTISDDADVRRAGVDHLRRSIRLAETLGARKVGGGLHSANGVFAGRGRTAQEWDRSVDALRAVAPEAQDAGITLTVEPVSRYSGYFLNTADDAIALVEEVDSPNVRVQLDTWHMNIEESDTPRAIRRVGPLLGHVHAVESNRGVPGTGQVPWTEVLRALRDVGYDDLLVYEHFPVGLPVMAARTHTWRDLGGSREVCIEGTRALRAELEKIEEKSNV